uniref:Uncharacterized protein n=1 Tax=Araucaria cunninghamii TaxID=56994 RepID=A0A0D6QW75_ARACU
MSKPWGVGGWAAEAEREEQEEKERRAAAAAGVAAAGATANAGEFPSLSESVSAKPKKKNKGQTMTLSQLQGYGRHDEAGLTPQELMSLPKAPRERTAEESNYGSGGLGGGFKDYGNRGSRFDDRERTGGFGGGGGGGSRRYGGFDDDRRADRDSMPSRADEADNWGSMKKSLPPPPADQFERRRYNGERERDRFEGASAAGSRADDADNWAASKKFLPNAAPPMGDRRSMGFGSSYRDPSDSDRWGRREPRSFADDVRPAERQMSYGNAPRVASSPALSLGADEDAPVSAPRPARPNPFGNARPREEVLAEKVKDLRKDEGDSESETRDENKYPSRPTSSHSSHPGSPVTKPRPKINPFGDAKPREEVLAAQGKDYIKIDFELEHRSVDRPETEEEIKLKQEINDLKEHVKHPDTEHHVENGKASEGDQQILAEQISLKEKDLERLTRDLDYKVRYVKRGGERPGSGAGRGFESFDRPRSQSGRSDGGRSFESFDRPRSRGGEGGGPDVWRSGDERRMSYGNRERRFTNRDRADSRSGW